jgi:hypothetical protein
MSSREYFTMELPVGTGLVDKINCIKAIRSLTGLGLKEAKEASERLGEQTLAFNTALSEAGIEEQFRILRVNGMKVGSPVHLILDDLRQLAVQAMQMQEDELANEITQLVLAEKLRRKSRGQLN